MAKKMILIDPAHMLLKTSPVPDTLADSVLRVDSDIRTILDRGDLSEPDKILAYQQALQQYLAKISQMNKRDSGPAMNQPNTSAAVTATPEDSDADKKDRLEKRVIASLPKTLRDKAKLLLDHVKEGTDMKWTERGEIMYNGEVIKDSNISDLINETVRARKTTDNPKGWNTYVKILKASNVPNDLIGNKERWNNPYADQFLTSTPRSSPRKKDKKMARKRNQHLSTSWSPY